MFQYMDLTPYPGVGKYAFFTDMDNDEPWHFDAFFEEDENVEYYEYNSQTDVNRKSYNVPCYLMSEHEDTDSEEYFDEFAQGDCWYIRSQSNNSNVNSTFIRANQIALIEERGMLTTSLQTKDKSCEAEPIVKNELIQTDMAVQRENEAQTEDVHMNSLSHVAAIMLPTIQVQVEESIVDFLVDTGSSVSIIKKPTKAINENKKPILQAVNGTYVDVKGVVTLNVMLQGQAYPHEFIVADVLHNIIGYDFWAAYQMFLRPTYQGVEVFAADMSPLLQVRNKLQPPQGVYKAVVNAIFPSKEGDTLGEITAYCEFQQWQEEEPVRDNLTVVPFVKTSRPISEIVFQLEYVKDSITGFPLYHPLQVHKDPMALVCAVIKDEESSPTREVHLYSSFG